MSCSYETLSQRCKALGLTASPAELHGSACAILSACRTEAHTLWRQEMLPDTDPNDVLAQEAHAALAALWEMLAGALADDDFRLALCLPDGGAERARGLREWCQGYLTGLGLSGARGLDANTEIGEALADFAHIGQLDWEAVGDEQTDAEDLAELEEYVRMAALLIREHLRPQAEQPHEAH